jgi:hybrid cluster-associated redox disulfide protein
MAVREVVSRYAGAAAVFEAHGLACAGCEAALFETVAQAALVHGVAIDVLLRDLNEALSD